MKERVFVTGSTGAIGRSLLARLTAEKDCFEVLAPSRQRSRSALNIHDAKQLFQILNEYKPDCIYHLVSTFTSDLDEAYHVNVKATHILCETVKQLSYGSRVVLVGSAAEYGNVPPNENPISETRMLKPVSVYGLTKAWQTQLGLMHASQGLDIVIARVFNVIGPHVSEQLLAGKLFKQISELKNGKRSFLELGNLDAVRDYVSTEQAAAKILMVGKRGQTGDIYNIGSGIPVKVRDLVQQELSNHGFSATAVRERDRIKHGTGSDVKVSYADVSKWTELANKGD